ncbi:hypothetical protein, partial [Mycobacterium montefiorense]|uniref:hypothetical protein n=1 Tax=Mycobacterium montefiorense TaxID=154654 RepID=UPI0021C33A41
MDFVAVCRSTVVWLRPKAFTHTTSSAPPATAATTIDHPRANPPIANNSKAIPAALITAPVLSRRQQNVGVVVWP